jgi:hypothetical protein
MSSVEVTIGLSIPDPSEFRAKPTRPLTDELAEVVGPEINDLMKKQGQEELTPAVYLDWVRANPNSTSHTLFDWEDTVAARKWRIHQARNIINSIEVKIIDERGVETHVPAFPNVIIRANEEHEARQIYTSFENVMNDEERAALVVDRACRDFMSWRRRYLMLRGKLPLSDIYEATDMLADELEPFEEDSDGATDED